MNDDFAVSFDGSNDNGQMIGVVRGEIDMVTAPQLDRHVEEAIARRPGGLVLEMSGVTFLDSSGCHALVRIQRRADDAGIAVELAGLNGSCLRVLEITGLTDVLTLREQ